MFRIYVCLRKARLIPVTSTVSISVASGNPPGYQYKTRSSTYLYETHLELSDVTSCFSPFMSVSAEFKPSWLPRSHIFAPIFLLVQLASVLGFLLKKARRNEGKACVHGQTRDDNQCDSWRTIRKVWGEVGDDLQSDFGGREKIQKLRVFDRPSFCRGLTKVEARQRVSLLSGPSRLSAKR